MNSEFPRLLRLLRTEKKISQKDAARQLGISQSLLSHYEKGIRECSLDFVIRAADLYSVSTDYLLGRSADRGGAPEEPDAGETPPSFSGSVYATMYKKLIASSAGLVFDLLDSPQYRDFANEAGYAISLAVYGVFRRMYAAGGNPPEFFSVPENEYEHRILSEQVLSAMQQGSCPFDGDITYESLAARNPVAASALLNLIKNTENRIRK